MVSEYLVRKARKEVTGIYKNSMKRILFLIILGWAVLQGLKAQTDAALSHYFMATAYYNPAAAGSTEDLKMLKVITMQTS